MSIRMSGPRQHWLASVFVLAGVASIIVLVMLSGGRWRVDSEWLGLGVGAVLVALLWIGLTGRHR